jgi:hypothetical protein
VEAQHRAREQWAVEKSARDAAKKQKEDEEAAEAALQAQLRRSEREERKRVCFPGVLLYR